MFKPLSTLLVVTLFLLFQTISIAEENQDVNTENVTEITEDETVDAISETDTETDTDIETEIENKAETTEEPDTEKEEISAAQREADEAEAAELREVGEGDEPVAE